MFHGTVPRPRAWWIAGGAIALAGCAAPVAPAPIAATARSADGLSIAYQVEGRGAVAVVFIHGWSCDRSYWRSQASALAACYRVVTLDLGGHGDSGSDRTAWTIASLADDVAAVVRAAGVRRAVLVGHSLGGPVALEAALRMPERVIGVVGVDAFFDGWATPAWDGVIAALRPDFRAETERFARSMFSPHADPALAAAVARQMSNARPEIALPLLEDLGAWARNRYATAVESWHRPFAIVMAGDPPPVPRLLQAHRNAFPHFEARGMDGVGHFLMMEDPPRFNAILAAILERMTSPP